MTIPGAPLHPLAEASRFGSAFRSPLLAPPSADPWVIEHDGLWYSLQGVARTLQLRTAPCFSRLGEAHPQIIWHAPAKGPFSRNLWAPELHFLDGRWFIYVAADDGRNENHRMWVLEAPSPCGPWAMRGSLETQGWAIDGTVLEINSERFFVWSGWPGRKNTQQNLYIAPMRTPWSLAGPRRLLCEPTESWERIALPLCEGPQFLQRSDKTFLVYSASGSWTADYCLGMLVHDGRGCLMDGGSWQKANEPVFRRTEAIWGVGHCCFARHDEAGDLLFYHAKTSRTEGWDDRHVRVQPFGWGADGLPSFGQPL